MHPTALVVGHVTHDRFAGGLLPGGAAHYGARTLFHLGASVRLMTAVGADFACEDAFVDFDVRARRNGTTTTFTNIYPPGGMRVQQVEGRADDVSPAELPPSWQQADLVFLAPVMGEIDLPAWRAAVRARVVGIGIQGWIRRAGPGGAVMQHLWAADGETLRGVDVACVGEEDLLGQGDLLDRLVANVPLVAYTHGIRGADLIQRGQTSHIGIFSTREVDPTGAGDSFAAGLLFGLACGETVAEAARLGAAAASVVVEATGGDALARVGEAFARRAAVG